MEQFFPLGHIEWMRSYMAGNRLERYSQTLTLIYLKHFNTSYQTGVESLRHFTMNNMSCFAVPLTEMTEVCYTGKTEVC